MKTFDWKAVAIFSLIGLVILMWGAGLLLGRGYGGWGYGGWGMMGPWMMGGMFFMWLIPLGLVALAVFGLAALVRVLGGGAGPAPSQNCPSCGRPIQADWRNCPHCGEPLPK
ncbi:MAG TPA: zinc ribbon domain-containing protein [Anaerolineales bacterium]